MNDALTRLDRALLDRVFQPIANRLAVVAEPPVLAESSLVGSAVMTLGQVAVDLRVEGLEISTILFGAFNLAGAVWLVRWYRAHGGLSAGSANPFREMPVWVSLRLFSIVNLLFSILLPALGIDTIGFGPFSVPLTSSGLSTAFDIASALLCLIGLYFAACRKPPPVIRTAPLGRAAHANG